jgi:hypothetical protein
MATGPHSLWEASFGDWIQIQTQYQPPPMFVALLRQEPLSIRMANDDISQLSEA